MANEVECENAPGWGLEKLLALCGGAVLLVLLGVLLPTLWDKNAGRTSETWIQGGWVYDRPETERIWGEVQKTLNSGKTVGEIINTPQTLIDLEKEQRHLIRELDRSVLRITPTEMVLSNPATGICSARAYQLELFRPEVGTTAKGHWSVTFKDKDGRVRTQPFTPGADERS